jgi:geranylgeranyl reductase family protein
MQAAQVAVVGAGPAGAAAAITAARAGLRVLLVDKAVFPRDKCCGDGLTTGALRHLHQLGLRPVSVESWQPVRSAGVRTAQGRTATFPLPTGGTYAASARRIDLDAALVKVARAAGVEVREGCTVTGARLQSDGGPTPSRVVLHTDDGDLPARFVVAADGAWSPLRKALGVPDEEGYRGDWHAFRQYFSGVRQPPSQLWVWFEADLVPGYAWSFPLPGGYANVGFGVHRRPGVPVGNLAPQWADLLTRPHIREALGPDAQPEQPARTWPIPARISRSELIAGGGRVLFVGDAARATDPMTGEGIAQALETGMVAADAISRAGADHPERASAEYRQVVRRSLAIDERVSRALSGVLRQPSDRWLDLATAGARMPRGFVRWMFEDFPRGVFLTPRRWHRGALHGAAPFPD